MTFVAIDALRATLPRVHSSSAITRYFGRLSGLNCITAFSLEFQKFFQFSLPITRLENLFLTHFGYGFKMLFAKETRDLFCSSKSNVGSIEL